MKEKDPQLRAVGGGQNKQRNAGMEIRRNEGEAERKTKHVCSRPRRNDRNTCTSMRKVTDVPALMKKE